MLRVGIDEATALEAVRERLDCSAAFAKQVVRQKSQRRASTSLKTSPTEERLREAARAAARAASAAAGAAGLGAPSLLSSRLQRSAFSPPRSRRTAHGPGQRDRRPRGA